MNIPECMQRLDELIGGFQRSQVLFTAVRAGVFGLLGKPVKAEAVAKATGWSIRGTATLLDVLVALELVEKKDGLYQNLPIASQCLVPGAAADQTHIIEHRANGWATWSRLEEAVRTGTGVAGASERSPDELRAFILGMSDIARHSAKAILDVLDLSSYRHMLDVGGGPGTYAIVFAQTCAKMRATVFDNADVLAIAREQVEKAGLLERVDFVPGDFTRDGFGQGYDLVFVSNVIHSYGPDENRSLMRKCHEALQPGGLLIVKDFLVDTGRTGPPFGLMFALHMLVHTEAGGTYTSAEVGEWTSAAGFFPGELLDLTPQTRLWLAKKRG